MCSSGTTCNDAVTRTTSWTGYVALPYITDWHMQVVREFRMNMQKQDSSNAYICKNTTGCKEAQ